MSEQPDRRLAQIAVMWHGGIGPAGFRRLLGYFGDAPAIMTAGEDELSLPSLRLNAEQIEAISQLGSRLGEVEEQLEQLHSQNIHVICDFEPEYPDSLRAIGNLPPVLCIAGRLLPVDEPAVAIVGTRSPSEGGFQMARELGAALAEQKITVISGLALGCDTGAHQGALSAGGRTIAVLGSGILVIHPHSNLELAREIAEHGAVISEQPPTAQPSVGRLMARNRLQSGLSRAIIVVESGESGGSMETANNAQRQGRLVCAVDWPQITAKRTGNRRLLAEGARPISSPEQVKELVTALYFHQQQRQREQAGESQQQLFAEE